MWQGSGHAHALDKSLEKVLICTLCRVRTDGNGMAGVFVHCDDTQQAQFSVKQLIQLHVV